MPDLTHLRIDEWSIAFLNEHISACSTPFLITSDIRVNLSDDEISELLNILERDDTIAIVQPKILVEDTNRLHPFGGLGGFTDRLGVGFIRGAEFGESARDSGQYDELHNTPDWILAPVMIIRREAFELACGLDDSFAGKTAWMDLGARLRNLGYELHCYSDVVVSYPSNNPVSAEKAVTSSLYSTTQYVIRHVEGPWPFVAILWILLELLFIPGNLIQFRFKLVSNRLKALYSTLKSLPGFIHDRYIVQEGIEIARKHPVTGNKPKIVSIFFNHYARLGKTASNLLTIFLVIASVFSLTMRDRR